MHIEIPLTIFGYSPLAAALVIVSVYIRRYGVPTLCNAVCGMLAFGGAAMTCMCCVCYGLKLFQPSDSVYSLVQDNYLLTGGGIGIGLLVLSVCVQNANK